MWWLTPWMTLYQAGLGDLCLEPFWNYSNGQVEERKELHQRLVLSWSLLPQCCSTAQLWLYLGDGSLDSHGMDPGHGGAAPLRAACVQNRAEFVPWLQRQGLTGGSPRNSWGLFCTAYPAVPFRGNLLQNAQVQRDAGWTTDVLD